jgi:hypothetical protein
LDSDKLSCDECGYCVGCEVVELRARAEAAEDRVKELEAEVELVKGQLEELLNGIEEAGVFDSIDKHTDVLRTLV